MKIEIRNAIILSRDFNLQQKNIYIDGNTIISLGDKPEGFIAEKKIDASGKFVLPGLINAHTHSYMSLFRNFADDRAFWDWLSAVQYVEDYMTKEDLYWGTLLNCIEMIKTGTTCFIDMQIKSAAEVDGPESGSTGAAFESGMRAVMTRGMIGDVGEEYPDRQLAEFLEEKKLFSFQDRVRFWFGPHAPYSCAAKNLKRFAYMGERMHIGQTIHLSESTSEVENSMKEHGMTPIAYVDSLGSFNIPTIAAHCVKATKEDIEIIARNHVSVAINPKSNMKLGNGFAPVAEMLEAGVNICLGTDGCGSNNSQNMFSEMNTAALIYKGVHENAVSISAKEILCAATQNGARAIGMEGKLGVLEEGALADLIILNLDEPEFRPFNNIISALVYSATGREVETSIINGEVVMENGKILTIDVDRVYEECEKIVERLNMKSHPEII